jgi:prolyl oligopeptidase
MREGRQFGATVIPLLAAADRRDPCGHRAVGVQPVSRFIATLAVTLAATAHAQSEDPFLWLEEVTGKEALAWVMDQNAKSQPVVENAPGFKTLLERFTAIANSRDRIPTIVKLGPRYYNFWQDTKNPRGVWRRTTLAEYRKAQPAWETILDLDQLSAAENEKWAWKGATCLYPKYERCLVSLSRGGSDAVEIREFDLVEKAFVEGGFNLPESKGDVAWIDADTIYAARDYGAGTLTRSGYPRMVKRVKRGQPLGDAPTVFEVSAEDVGAHPDVTLEDGYRHEVMWRSIDVRRAEIHVLRNDRFVHLDLQDSAEADLAAKTLYVRLRDNWKPAATEFRAGTLLAIDLERFLGGARDFDVLFTPSPRVALESFSPMKTMVLLDLLDNVASRLVEAKRGPDGKWTQRGVETPKFATIGASALERRESDDYLMTRSGFTTPTALFLAKGRTNAREKLKNLPEFFDATGLVVTQHEARSRDGTKIPYFQVMRKGAKADGRNPTILNGYGGFEISEVPSYSAFVGNGWLARGGVWVLANLRGGGEFGPEWHQAALRENRQRIYEDFAAVAEDLIARKITSPAKLGILGGSQGGLLVTATMLQRPELFGAVVATVPLIDMRRYHKLLAGASWMGEYGDPDKPEDWAFISKYSPYQNLKKDATYPKILITTSTHDDRVHPGHARKMAALMQSMGHPAIYFEYTEGGHGAGTTPAQTAYTWAFIYTFFAQTLM